MHYFYYDDDFSFFCPTPDSKHKLRSQEHKGTISMSLSTNYKHPFFFFLDILSSRHRYRKRLPRSEKQTDHLDRITSESCCAGSAGG